MNEVCALFEVGRSKTKRLEIFLIQFAFMHVAFEQGATLESAYLLQGDLG